MLILSYLEVCGKRFRKRPSRLRRVVGGRESVPNTWPWQALVLFSDPKHICGATLVRRNWLVTAASCFGKKNFLLSLSLFLRV
jgi:secreted trypsin-like serine protease